MSEKTTTGMTHLMYQQKCAKDKKVRLKFVILSQTFKNFFFLLKEFISYGDDIRGEYRKR